MVIAFQIVLLFIIMSSFAYLASDKTEDKAKYKEFLTVFITSIVTFIVATVWM
ncbi:hypothetical protein [Salicibibacter halophilus]|uniref:hypothetical protein n=1 Tax=Salicibibacter halophilus TaxID=2502791 RepID=UPI0013589857|nr:hypothetical protein [Salicibibacter halophilus]